MEGQDSIDGEAVGVHYTRLVAALVDAETKLAEMKQSAPWLFKGFPARGTLREHIDELQARWDFYQQTGHM